MGVKLLGGLILEWAGGEQGQQITGAATYILNALNSICTEY